jgi:mannitol-specific phosphotransferase system IIBC component
MIGQIIQGMLGAIVSVVAFITVRALVDGLSTSGWSTAEVTIMTTLLPLAIAIMAVVVVFLGLQKMTGSGS